ncbi:MAG: hypothetical protein EOM30_01005 [Clostridia bacterium]|nr:hypothetical protein [Clostridia bacterium]NLS85364.1 hypothetical protein [Oscillospiraceae bacterium]
MTDFKKSLAALIKVKTIVTMAVITVFCILSINGKISSDLVMNVVTMVIAFYFGIQKEQNNN